LIEYAAVLRRFLDSSTKTSSFHVLQMWQSYVGNCFCWKMKTKLNVLFHWNTYQSGNKGRNVKETAKGKNDRQKMIALGISIGLFHYW